jgi:hypothetical protein
VPIRYENIVPWGRSFEEYVRMLNLKPGDLNKRILSCGDGPASFNAAMNTTGLNVTSIDPIYQYSKKQIKDRIKETINEVMLQTKNNEDKFVWKNFHNIEELFKVRMSAMTEFLNDYDKGKSEKRYIFAELPKLPFKDKSFDLIVSAHFLLFYSENLSLEFHLESIKEMCRLGNEIRIFPIVDLNANTSCYLRPVKEYIHSIGWLYEEVEVNYEFQKNGNRMLKLNNK